MMRVQYPKCAYGPYCSSNPIKNGVYILICLFFILLLIHSLQYMTLLDTKFMACLLLIWYLNFFTKHAWRSLKLAWTVIYNLRRQPYFVSFCCRFSSENAKLNCVTISVILNFYFKKLSRFVLKLCGISMILLTDLLYGTTFYYFSIDLRFVCIFNKDTLHDAK